MKWFQRAFLGVSAITLLTLVGCGGGSAPITLNQSTLPTLGEIDALVQASTAPDSDGDFIPDDVEQGTLGTNHLDRDSDRDGLPDNYEVFGSGIFDPNARVPDEDGDGLIAALDKDDNGDFINDGLSIDTDEDGVANYLEFYGYTYDWMTGRFVSCEDIDCTGLTIYKSDPLQRSTDQDVYPDGQEVSGVGMDVTVDYPGDHPLVPAYPELVIELVSYSVTLNEDIEYGKGGSLSRGQEWGREAATSHTQTTELNWEVGVDMGGQDKFKVSVKGGGSVSWANETSYSVSTGASIVSQSDWSESRSVNPTDAARVKLLLKMHNRGTASVSNIVPTLTLKIAGLNVTTFEPGNPKINLLTSGTTYPAEEGSYWVVDSTLTGAPLSLTMTELRALETGAPVGVTMTQVKGDVLRLNDDGAWESAGECQEFQARCDAACASLLLDMGDGNSLHRMVYCRTGSSGPTVTLGDALRWTANATVNTDGGYEVSYLDRDGVWTTVSLVDWAFAFDPDTLKANGFDPNDLAGTMPADFDLGLMVLLPDSNVIGKAPRTEQIEKPLVHFATINDERRTAAVCATDYRGVEFVEVVASVDTGDGSGPTITRWLMQEQTPGSNLYVYTFDDDGWEIIEGIYERVRHPEPGTADILTAEATAVGGALGVGVFGEIPPRPQPVPPLITHVMMDVANRDLYSRVVPDQSYPDSWHESNPVVWVRAYHPAFTGGYVKMTPVSNSYEDPYGMHCLLPENAETMNVKIVAFVAPGVYTERLVLESEVAAAYLQGERTMIANFMWDAPQIWPWDLYDFYSGGVIDLDGWHTIFYTSSYYEKVHAGTPWTYSPWYLTPDDFWTQWDDRVADPGWKLSFVHEFAKYDGIDYKDIDYALAKAKVDSATATGLHKLEERGIWVYRTNEGRIGKLEITKLRAWRHKFGFVDAWPPEKSNETTFRFVVFQKPAAVISEVSEADSTVNAGDSIPLTGEKSVLAWTYGWEITAWPAASAQPESDAATKDNENTSFIPDVEGSYTIKLTINAGESDEHSIETQVEVKWK